MKRHLLLIVSTLSIIFFFFKLGFAQVNEYSLDPVDFFITPNDSTVEVDIKINIIDTIYAFVVPLEVSGTSNPVLDTVLTGGLKSLNPPAFNPPSLVSGFTQRVVNPYGSPALFLAIDFTGGLIPPKTGLFCKMFFKVSGPGTLIFRTAVHPTGGPAGMNGPRGPVPINWHSPEEVGSFEVLTVTNNIWAHLSGSPEIARGETLMYTSSYGNVSNVEATQCSLFMDFGELHLVWSSQPYTAVGDTAAIWLIGTLQPGESRKILVDITPPPSPSLRYPPENISIWDIFTFFGGLILGDPVSDSRTVFLEETDPHPDIALSKEVPTVFHPPSDYFRVIWANLGHGRLCIEPLITAEIWCDEPGCLLGVSSDIGNVTPGDRWKIEWRPGDLSPGGQLPYFWHGATVFLSLATNPTCAHKIISFHAWSKYDNENYEPTRDKWNNNIQRQPHEIRFAWDPNEIVVYPEDFIMPSHSLNYAVFFENEGSAPAESIRIISEIDTALADETVFITDTSAVYNAFHRRIDWNFPHINLQPESSSFVSYSIQAKDSLQSGTVIKANSMIYFDYMPGVPCSVSVTVDALNPISRVDSAVWISYPDTFKVFWSGYDPLPGSSGITSYFIYVSVDGGPDSLWLADTSWFEDDTLKTSAIFVADSGHYYSFTSIAMDRVWNIEEAPTHPDVYFPFMRGDAYRDGKINVSDVIYIINYLFKGGPYPVPLEVADVNCDGKVNVADVIYLINYLFKGGPPIC